LSEPSIYLNRVIKELSRLPGIGSKSAARIAFHLLRQSSSGVQDLVNSISDLKENILTCNLCGGISDSPLCAICSDSAREKSVLCIVEGARDMLTIEATGEFKGLYHVISGLISPLDGIGPSDLNLAPLMDRLSKEKFSEVIIALNPTIEGEATTLYLAGLMEPFNLHVTRIAHGLPVGSDLEYVDIATIAKSIEGRVKI
jgi:recombination protein RecR